MMEKGVFKRRCAIKFEIIVTLERISTDDMFYQIRKMQIIRCLIDIKKPIRWYKATYRILTVVFVPKWECYFIKFLIRKCVKLNRMIHTVNISPYVSIDNDFEEKKNKFLNRNLHLYAIKNRFSEFVPQTYSFLLLSFVTLKQQHSVIILTKTLCIWKNFRWYSLVKQ